MKVLVIAALAACCSALLAEEAAKDARPAPIPVTVVAGDATNRYNLAAIAD